MSSREDDIRARVAEMPAEWRHDTSPGVTGDDIAYLLAQLDEARAAVPETTWATERHVLIPGKKWEETNTRLAALEAWAGEAEDLLLRYDAPKSCLCHLLDGEKCTGCLTTALLARAERHICKEADSRLAALEAWADEAAGWLKTIYRFGIDPESPNILSLIQRRPAAAKGAR